MKKKVLAAMLVAAMTATMFAGCGSNDNGASNDGTQAANSGSTSESAEPVDVKLLWDLPRIRMMHRGHG